MTTLSILWFVLIFVLIIGYFALDGFDLGTGVLYPFLGKNERSKKIMMRAIGPVWDGNEVWLLTAGGALFAAFAPAYATSFSGFYLAIMLVLMGLIVRAVAIGFGGHGESSRLCDGAFFVGSLLPALLFGVAVGNVIAGVPLNANGDYIGTFFALLTPFALACGVLGLVHMMLQGACWLAAKAPEGDPLQVQATNLRKPLALISLVMFLICTVLFKMTVVPNSSVGMDMTIPAIIAAVAYLASLLYIAFVSGGKDFLFPVISGLGCAALCIVWAATSFPYFIPASNDPTLSITIASAAGSDLTLTVMTIIAAIGVPLVLLYHVLLYRAFAGRVTDEDLHEGY